MFFSSISTDDIHTTFLPHYLGINDPVESETIDLWLLNHSGLQYKALLAFLHHKLLKLFEGSHGLQTPVTSRTLDTHQAMGESNNF